MGYANSQKIAKNTTTVMRTVRAINIGVKCMAMANFLTQKSHLVEHADSARKVFKIEPLLTK